MSVFTGICYLNIEINIWKALAKDTPVWLNKK